MKNAVLFLFLLIIALPATTAQSLTDYPQISLGKDNEGKDVMFHFMQVPQTSTFDLLYYDTFDRFIIKIDDMASIYDCKTLDHISTFRQKGERIELLFEDGYIPDAIHGGKINFYDFNGKKVWSKNKKVVLDLDSIIILSNNPERDKLTACDRSTGKELWSLNIANKKQSLSKVYASEQDHFYVLADSIYRVDSSTGKHICRRYRTYQDSNSFFFGNNYSGINSSLWAKGDSLFIADADSLYCFDTEFRSIWQTALPKDTVGKSFLWVDNGKINLYSPGWAYLEKSTFKHPLYGPFAATFDITNGKNLSTFHNDMDKTSFMLLCDDGMIYTIRKDKVFYARPGDTSLTEIKFKPNSDKAMSHFYPGYLIKNEINIIKDGVMTKVKSDKDHAIISVDNKEFYLLTPAGRYELLPNDEVFFYDINNFYATFANDNGLRAFAKVDPDTNRVTFHGSYVNGKAFCDKNGTIIIRLKTGIGVHKGQPTGPQL